MRPCAIDAPVGVTITLEPADRATNSAVLTPGSKLKGRLARFAAQATPAAKTVIRVCIQIHITIDYTQKHISGTLLLLTFASICYCSMAGKM
jgi:hypothetical protein